MPYPTPYTDEYMRVLCNWITTRRMDPEIATWSRIDPAGRPTPPTVIVQHPHAEDVSDEVHAELTRAGWVVVHQSDAPRETFYQPLDRATMTVTVRDRSRESDHDYGPYFTTVTIPAVCPRCGGPRGEPVRRPFAEDGAFYAVDQWENPCGHIDAYPDVIAEGRRFAQVTTVRHAQDTAETPQDSLREVIDRGDALTCPTCGTTIESVHVVRDATVTFTLERHGFTGSGHIARYAWQPGTPALTYLDETVTYAMPCNCLLTAPYDDAMIAAMERRAAFHRRPE